MSTSGEKANGSRNMSRTEGEDSVSTKPASHKRALKTKMAAPPPHSTPKIRGDPDRARDFDIDLSEINADTKNETLHGVVEPDEILLDDSEGTEMEPHVSQLINQLSSQIHHRVRAKKQRLDHNFQAVYSIPARITALQNEQRASRERVITEFKDAIGNINEKLNEVVQLQVRNEEKQGKMVIALTRENEAMKKLITECNDLQRASFTKFAAADKNMSKQMESEAAQDADQNTKSVLLLQKKLLADGQKEGSEALYNLHRLI